MALKEAYNSTIFPLFKYPITAAMTTVDNRTFTTTKAPIQIRICRWHADVVNVNVAAATAFLLLLLPFPMMAILHCYNLSLCLSLSTIVLNPDTVRWLLLEEGWKMLLLLWGSSFVLDIRKMVENCDFLPAFPSNHSILSKHHNCTIGKLNTRCFFSDFSRTPSELFDSAIWSNEMVEATKTLSGRNVDEASCNI